MKRRPPDPFKHNGTMSAMAVLVRAKADRIDAIADGLLQVATSDSTLARLHEIKVKALEITDIVEGKPV